MEFIVQSQNFSKVVCSLASSLITIHLVVNMKNCIMCLCNFCMFLLQATEWQQATEDTIDRLADTSATVASQLDNASELQLELIRRQNDSLEKQQQIIERGTELRQTLEESKSDVRAIMMDLKSSTAEQRNLIFEVFDRVNSLQSIVMGEFTGFYSLIFYGVSTLIAYLLTSTPRTSGARFWLFLTLTMNVGAEWIISKWYSTGGTNSNYDFISGSMVDESV